MSESSGKRRKRYVDHLKSDSQTCLIHGPGNLSDGCKVLGDFCFKYAKIRSTEYRVQDPVLRNNFKRQKENNDIVNSAVDEILLH